MKSNSYPEFSTLKIDMDTLKPHSLVQTVLDINATYGLSESELEFGSVPYTTQAYKDHFGINDLSEKGLSKSLSTMANAPLETQLDYMTAKIGYVLKSQYHAGIERLASWSLLSQNHENTIAFQCQILQAKDKELEGDCLAR